MLSKKRRNILFIEAGILTLIVYFSALFLNGYLDHYRFIELENKIDEININSEASIILSDFHYSFSTNNCSLRKNYILNEFIKLKLFGKDLTNYGQLFLKSNENFSLNKQREYFLEEINLLNEVLKYNNKCNEDKLFYILYFFNSKKTNLDKQSIILEQFSLNNKNKSIIFSFDISYKDEPILEDIKKNYNVTYSPFIIIENKTSRLMHKTNGIVDLNSISVEFKKFRGEIK